MVVLSRIIVDGVGGGDGAAPRGSMVDGVVMERLHEGRHLRTMGGSGGGRRVRPRQTGRKKIWCDVRGRLLGWSLLPYFTLFYLILPYFTLF